MFTSQVYFCLRCQQDLIQMHSTDEWIAWSEELLGIARDAGDDAFIGVINNFEGLNAGNMRLQHLQDFLSAAAVLHRLSPAEVLAQFSSKKSLAFDPKELGNGNSDTH
jgi:hypothetical protein